MNHQINIDEAIAIAKNIILKQQKTSAVKTGIFSFNLNKFPLKSTL